MALRLPVVLAVSAWLIVSVGSLVVVEDAAAAPAVAEGAHGEVSHAGPPPNPLRFDSDLAIWTVVVFLLLLAVLRWVAWGPITEALAARENSITGEIAAANLKHEDAKRLLAAHEAKLATAADEIRELLEEARRDAEHTKQEILTEAKSAALAERQRAVREVELARDAALKQLAETSANAAIKLASSAVRQNLTAEQQSRIVRESLSMIGSGPASQN
ncbi:MAG: ATP synthase F0 subunit B [Pirellulales bacterium]